jgi:hypothetical protein
MIPLLMRRIEDRFVPVESFAGVRRWLRRRRAGYLAQRSRYFVLGVPELPHPRIGKPSQGVPARRAPIRRQNRLPHRENVYFPFRMLCQQFFGCGGPPQTEGSGRREHQNQPRRVSIRIECCQELIGVRGGKRGQRLLAGWNGARFPQVHPRKYERDCYYAQNHEFRFHSSVRTHPQAGRRFAEGTESFPAPQSARPKAKLCRPVCRALSSLLRDAAARIPRRSAPPTTPEATDAALRRTRSRLRLPLQPPIPMEGSNSSTPARPGSPRPTRICPCLVSWFPSLESFRYRLAHHFPRRNSRQLRSAVQTATESESLWLSSVFHNISPVDPNGGRPAKAKAAGHSLVRHKHFLNIRYDALGGDSISRQPHGFSMRRACRDV